MSLADQNKLADALRRGRLTVAEETELQAYLASHPELRAGWEEELSLNQLLRQVPDAPVSSNFTRRVVQAVHQEFEGRSRAERGLWSRLVLVHWAPKLAIGAAAISLGVFSYHEHQLATRRELARNLVEISRLAS